MAGESKGDLFNERVWRMFEAAGFLTKPSRDDPAEREVEVANGKTRPLDLDARLPAHSVHFVGQNKSRKQVDSRDGLVNDCAGLLAKSGAQRMLLISYELDFTEAEKEAAQKQNVIIWNGDDFEYYETVVDAIGEYARFEIVLALGLAMKNKKNHSRIVPAIEFHQPASQDSNRLFMFTAEPDFLLETCQVFRRASKRRDAYQRMVNKKRLAAIQKFVSKAGAVLPPAIIGHFSPAVNIRKLELPTADVNGANVNYTVPGAYELVALEIPAAFGSIDLLDGQHRLFAFARADPQIRDSFNMTVIGLLGLPARRQKETFVAINDKARRMDPNLVAILKVDGEDEAALQARSDLMAIKVVLKLNEHGPLKDRIRVLDRGDERITLKGLSGYDLKSLLGKRGLLRLALGSYSSDDVTQALNSYLGIVQSEFSQEWKDNERFIICTNRGLSAWLKLLRSMIAVFGALPTPDEIRGVMKALKANWPETWEIRELRSSYVGGQGWSAFHRDMLKAIGKSLPEFAKLPPKGKSGAPIGN